MGAPPVVVGPVLGRDCLQMPLAEDQHPVSNLGPDGKPTVPHEHSLAGCAAGSLRPGSRRRPDRVKRRGELPGPVPEQEPEVRSPIIQIHQQIADRLHGPRTVRVRGDPRTCTKREPTSITNRQCRRCRVTAQSTWKKSVASMVDAWACRNFRQVASVCRSGAGGIFRALRTRRIVDALTRWPSLSSSPWIRWYPQPWFSAASRPMSAAISALTGGRPARFG
jgi:hypothetical protein